MLCDLLQPTDPHTLLTMGLIQSLVKTLLPAATAARIEAESREWMMRCPDGHEISVWDAGGVRAGAAGKPSTAARCPGCGRVRIMQLYRAQQP
jgi:hypothetical protein